MKERVLKKVQKALTSGKYRKIRDQLHEKGGGTKTKCCFLGVICDVHRIENGGEWDENDNYLGERTELPSEVMHWAGLNSDNPDVLHKGETKPVIELNDCTKTTLAEFAEILGQSQKEGLLGPLIKDVPRRKKKQKPKTKKKGPCKMSYTKLGSLLLTDIASLRKAVIKNPKLTWVEGAKTYQHEYSQRNCVHKIQVAGSKGYEIGVIDHPDGTGYQLIWDSSSSFESVIGAGASIINTDYTREVARDHAARNGYTMTETAEADGSIVFTLTN